MSPDRIRICFFIPDLSDGGAQRQCAAISNEMATRTDVDFNLILLGEGPNFDDLNVPSSRIHKKQFSNFSDPRALLYVTQKLSKLRPDVLVSWLHPADLISAVASHVTGTKWIVAERDSQYPSQLIYKARRIVGSTADAIIANSQMGADYWSGQRPRKSATVIPNIVLQPTSNRAWNGDLNQVLSVGRLEPQKNVSQVISIFAAALPEMSGAKLAIVGNGSLRESLVEEARALNIMDNVEFRGFRRDVHTEYAASRLMISASNHEGMPNVLLESIAAGLTPLVSRIPEHTAILGEEYPYYLHLDRDSSYNKDVLIAAWKDANPQNKLEYGRALIEDLTPSRITSTYIRSIKSILT